MARKLKIDNAELKRRRYEKPQRKTRIVICRILIVCEGAKTEPNYFKAFNKIQRGAVVYEIETAGGGINTMTVVEEAIRLRGEARIPYDAVWAVFDRDCFPAEKFDNAINKAQSNDIDCAWSNEAFELWYLLHFHHRVTAMSRADYSKAISDAVNRSSEYRGEKYVYKKNARDNHEIMNTCGSQDDAIRRAKSLNDGCVDKIYHKHNPCTCVYKLVSQLIGKDDEFNAKIKAKMGE